jgi:hypothetical protein
MLTTSVSLPAGAALLWRHNKREIMCFAARFLRIQMRKAVCREVTRTYNRAQGEYQIVTTRFTPAEYDTLHFVAASFRVSVSSLICGLIQLWTKPARRNSKTHFVTNYCTIDIIWNQTTGILEENLTFWNPNVPIEPLTPNFLKFLQKP